MAITFDVGFRADTKELSASLSTIQREVQAAFSAPTAGKGMSTEIAAAVKQAQILEQTLKKATTEKGTSFIQMNLELKKMGTSAEEMVATLAKAGPAFSGSLNTMLQTFATADRNLLSMSAKIKEMGRVLTQSFKFSAAQSAIQFVTGEAQEAIQWVQKLDSQLNTIQIVSGKTAAEMGKVYDVVIQKSKELRVTAQDYAEASQIFYQQGLGDEEVARRSEITIQAAKAAGQSTSDMADQLTAVWNTYQMQGDELQRAASVGAKMGAETAVEFKDIAEAMQISASAASQMGVSYDSLAAIIATVGETTKQSASVIGNAYKTIFSRFYNLKAAGEEGAVELGQISNNLKQLGVDILDSSGELIELDNVIQNVGNSWDTYTQKQKIAIAEQVGGTRQYGQFLALMENFDKYQKNLASANAETGAETLLEQYETSLESIDSAMENAAESWSRAFSNVFTSDAQKDFYRGLEDVGDVLNDVLTTAGGLKGIITLIAAYMVRHIPAGAERLKDTFITLKDNFTLDNQLKSAAESMAKMRQEIADTATQNTANNIGFKPQQGFGNLKSENSVEADYLNTKLNITEKVTQATIRLQNIEKHGTAEAQRQAQAERQTLELAQKRANTAVDELKTMRDQAKQQQIIANAARNRAKRSAGTAAAKDDYKRAEQLTAALKANQAAAETGQQGLSRYRNAIADLGKYFNDGSEDGKIFAQEMKAISRSSQDLTGTMGSTIEAIQHYRQQLEEAQAADPTPARQREIAALQQLEAEQTAILGTQMNLADANRQVGESTNRVSELMQKCSASVKNFGDSAMQAVSSTLILVQGFSALKSAAEDGEVTFGEVASSLLMIIPSTVSLVKSLGGVASSALTMAVNLGATSGGIYATAIAEGTLTGATIAQTIATEGLVAALAPFLPIILAVAAAIATVVAVGVGLVSLWEELSSRSPEAKLERAKEAAAGLAEEEKAAKEASDNLRQSFDAYSVAEDKLDSLTRGTEEWKDALEEVNSAAMILLNSLDDLSAEEIKSLYTREDGRVKLDENKIKELQDQADNRADSASYAAAVGANKVAVAQNNLDMSKIVSSLVAMQKSDETKTDEDGHTVHTNPLWKDAGQITQVLTENLGDLSKVTEAEFKGALEDAGIVLNDYAGSTTDLYNQTVALAEATSAAEEKMSLISQLQVDSMLGDDYGDEEKIIAADKLEARTQEIYDEQLKQYTDGVNKFSEADNKQVAQMLKDYNEATGKNWVMDSKNAVRGTDGNRTFAFRDEEGELHELSKEQVAQTVAASLALKELTGNADAAAITMADLDKNASKAGAEGIKNFITEGNFNTMTESQIKGITEQGDRGIEDWLVASFGATDIESLAKDLGYSSGAKLVAGVKEGFEESQGALEDVGKDLDTYAKTIFDGIDLSNATVESRQNIETAFSQIYSQFGPDMAQQFADMMSGTSTEFLGAMDDIDWQNQGVESIRLQFEELGVSTQHLSDDQLTALIEMMQTATEIDLESASKKFSSIKDAVSGLESNSDSISEEQMQQLNEAGLYLDEYFTKMADGTYQLAVDANEFAQMVHDLAMKDLYEVRDNSADLVKQGQSVMGVAPENMTTEQQATALQITGNATAGAIAQGVNETDAAYAERVKAAFDEANISADLIEAHMQEAAQQANEAQEAIDAAEFQFDVESAGLDLDETSRYAARLAKDMAEAAGETDLTQDTLKKYEKAAQQAAIRNQKLDRGLLNLNENLEDYKKKLKTANKGTAEWSETMDSLKGDLSDIVGFDDPDLLTDDFAEATLESDDLKLALDGDVEAIKRLQTAAADDMMLNIVVNQSEDPDLLATQWANLKTQMETAIASPEVDQTELINSFNEMIANGNMTKDQIEAALAGMHVSADVVTTYTQQEQKVPLQVTEEYADVAWKDVTYYDEDGESRTARRPVFKKYTKSYTAGYETAMVSVPSYEIQGTTDEGGNTTAFIPAPAPKVSNGSTTSGTTGGDTGGGGGSAPKHSAKKADKREKLEDRYGTRQSSIDKSARAIDRYSSAMDSAFGASKMRNLKNINRELVTQARNYNELYKLAKRYYGDEKSGDYAEMLKEQKSAAEALGVSLIEVTTNADGFISNRTEIINQLDAQLQAAYDAYKTQADAFDKAQSTDEAWSERIDKLKEDYEDLKREVDEYVEAMDQVDETAQKMAEAMEEAVQAIRDHFSNLVEQSNLKLELRLAIDETDIKMAEFLIETLGDVGVRTGEAWSLLNDNLKSSQKSLAGMVQNTEEMFGILDQIKSGQNVDGDKFSAMFGEEAWKKYIRSDGVVPQEVMDQLGEMADSMVDNLQTQFDTGAEMIDQYIQILEMTMDEFDKIATKIEQQNETLDMYMDLLDFSGKDHTAAGRQAVKDIADARMSNAAVEVERAKAQLDTAKLAAEQAQGQLDDFFSKYGTDESSWTESQTWMYNQLKDNVNDAEDILNDAQSTFTGSIQDLASTASEAIEQMAQVIKEQTAESLGGLFADFESMTEMYDTEYELSHFFLEDYDKAYQLNTLLGEINDQMEDITDPARLNEYNALLEETNALNQEGVNVTQNDIELLKAKFEIQKAQDAYEEAKAAKNTMRLARDASGNWNYIYSSEQSQTEDAAQKLADAQYNYDKLLHEMRDESSQLWMQAQQEFFEWQETIDWARYNSNETYRQQIDTQYEQYRQKTQLYSEQVIKYNNLLGENFAETALGVATQYDSMEAAQLEYTNTHAQYNEDLKQNQESFEAKVEEVCTNVGIDYNNLAEEVGEKTLEMQKSNNNLSANITTLKNKAASDLTAMNTQISSWKDRFISDMDAAIRKVRELIAEIQRLRAAQLAEASTGFDAEIDYTAVGYNAIGAGTTEEQQKALENLKNNAEGQKLAAEWANKVNSEDLADAGHKYATGGVTSDDYWKAMENAVANGTIKGTIEAVDSSDAAKQVGNQGSTLDISKLPGYASGGLVSGYQIAKLAEDNRPEYVLNPDDTLNVLNAVKYAQKMVEMQMAQKKLSDAVAFEQAENKIFSDIASLRQATTTPVAQDVKIEATFPNVSVASEIEEAFNNLVNQAVQYVGKANKK